MKLLAVSFLLKLLSVVMPLCTVYSLGPNDTADCVAHPDPHVQTFDGIRYDYQHGCDVVLIDSSSIKIQLRLKKNQATSHTFSEIDRLAIHFLNGETLEIDSVGNHYLTSMNDTPNPIIYTIGGFAITKTLPNGSIGETTYKISLSPPGHFIEVVDLSSSSEGGGLGIFIRGHGSLFYTAIGMCGKWNAPVPGLYSRAGIDLLPSLPPVNPSYPWVLDASSFGDNWQVNPPETNHISVMGLPLNAGLHSSYPNTCVARRRFLEEERVLQPSCDYCLGLNNLDQMANCEYDAMVLGCWWVQQVPFYKIDDTFWYKDDTCCYRKVPAENGFTHADATPNTKYSFSIDTCDHATGSECYSKKKCTTSDQKCFILKKCEGDDCFREDNCFSKCVRRAEVEEGYKVVKTDGNGFLYGKCPHNDNCLEIKPCVPSAQNELCEVYKECSVTNQNDDICYKDFPCPGPCHPTSTPTTNPTPTSTTIPSATPSATPTKSDVGDPKKCHGCKWLQKQGWAIKSGQDKCKSRINVKVKGEKGKCLAGLSGKQCIPEPCQYKYEVKYSIKQKCVKNKSCVLIVSDPYTAGTAPTTPIVTLIEKEKGKIKKLEIKVECQCKTNIKLFKLQCETTTGTSSKSIMLDYSCSECDLMYLPGGL